MAQFPPNLDDGEVWLPSDIFINEKPITKFNPHHHISCSCSCYCMQDEYDELAKRFAAFALRNVSKPNPNSERFRQAVRYGSVTQGHAPLEYILDLNGGYGRSSSRNGHRLSHEHLLVEQPQPPQDVYENNLRARVLKSQQNRVQNRVYPFQASSGFGVSGGGRGGGFVKESGGTGVFHPRILNTTTTTTTTTDLRKKQALRNRQEIQATQHLKAVGMGKQRESHHYLPPEMALPQDWTY
ncbi:uncharacterized protein LOC112031466 [Quercus suber]|uniref:Uncharacterized protein n=1 Tax=Quercus suber TaxID=58331 RepID=A0AAW0KEX9_QUESU|nr:uncharacterized protein LOC112031466 [Quercus suber]POF00868.1 hypothetical protein CFP56_47679 [Quercus suber]